MTERDERKSGDLTVAELSDLIDARLAIALAGVGPVGPGGAVGEWSAADAEGFRTHPAVDQFLALAKRARPESFPHLDAAGLQRLRQVAALADLPRSFLIADLAGDVEQIRAIDLNSSWFRSMFRGDFHGWLMPLRRFIGKAPLGQLWPSSQEATNEGKFVGYEPPWYRQTVGTPLTEADQWVVIDGTTWNFHADRPRWDVNRVVAAVQDIFDAKARGMGGGRHTGFDFSPMDPRKTQPQDAAG